MSGRLTARRVEQWADELAAVGDRLSPHFARSEPRQRALGYVRALLSATERKNGWQLAEHLGHRTPRRRSAPARPRRLGRRRRPG
jgi:hypothetical protein